MHPAAPSIFLICSLALVPFCTVSWEIKLSDLEEKDVDEFGSSGLKCPTCFAVHGGECDPVLKWCAADRIHCVEFTGIVNTGVSRIPIEMKKCIPLRLCRKAITSYMGFPITNESTSCKSAIKNGATVRPPTPIFLVLFLEKILH